jgi:hypothetical protein
VGSVTAGVETGSGGSETDGTSGVVTGNGAVTGGTLTGSVGALAGSETGDEADGAVATVVVAWGGDDVDGAGRLEATLASAVGEAPRAGTDASGRAGASVAPTAVRWRRERETAGALVLRATAVRAT